MSKVVLVCYRDRNKRLGNEVFEALTRRIIPDNIEPNPPLVGQDSGLSLAVINPNDALITEHNSVCTGYLIDRPSNWWQPNAKRPDGTYALFRTNKHYIELVSDTCATQTIWYVMTRDMFIASTSQRAIIYFLQDFRPSLQARLWMLSSGNIGPGLSWDKRIKSLKGNSSLLLNRHTWILEEKIQPLEFNPIKASYNEHKRRYMDVISDALNQTQIDYTKWCLTLSGGFDSRCILLMLKNKPGLNCVTWGLKSALDNDKSDASIAKTLADHFGLNHTYLYTDTCSEDFADIIHRILIAGEGRSDTISGYMDGCNIWKNFFETNVSGIIRGDALISTPHEYTDEGVKTRNGMLTLSDYNNLDALRELRAERQHWPEQFYRREHESFTTWCGRMTYEYRASTYWAALNEIKSSYVEVMNPLLSAKIIECFLQLPDKLRQNNTLYWDIVRTLSPKNIPFAEHIAIASLRNILRSRPVVSHFSEALDTLNARDLLTDELVDFVLINMHIQNGKQGFENKTIHPAIKRLVPKRIRKYVSNAITPRNLDPNALAIRAYIIDRMHAILSDDAQAFKKAYVHEKADGKAAVLYALN